MSWFDASGFANLAKSALKEAQKTIDKALDIKDEEQKISETSVIDETNFFAAWGIKNDEMTSVPPTNTTTTTTTTTNQDMSVWGSFTGSFFDTTRPRDDLEKSSRISGSFDEMLRETTSITPSISLPDRLTYAKEDAEKIFRESAGDCKAESCKSTGNKPLLAHIVNQVSIVSSGSDKKSSESVEILGSRSGTNTDCTTTPDSEIVSPSESLSPSTLNQKRNSESVEVLPDSLVTSPSSVEVIEDNSQTDSPFLSPIDASVQSPDATTSFEPETESFADSSSDISPYVSPMVESKAHKVMDSVAILPSQILSFSPAVMEKSTSPVVAEIVQTTDELDEISQAEDSYTSASEVTVMTMMDTFQQQLEVKKINDSCPEASQSICPMTLSSGNQLETSVDSFKDSKHSLHLNLAPITTQPIRKTESLTEKMETFDRDLVKSATIEPLNPSTEDQTDFSTLENHQSTTMLTDSSCEGTLVDTSSEDNVPLKNIRNVDSETEETSLTSSSYVKNMLADAMVDKSEIIGDLERQDVPTCRGHSPISSESRSDLVKIGSDHASGHTSGDELETTTSSDIEIISSPNGDSSSTQSRQSPANLHSHKSSDLLTKTLKTRGHSRELSEISIGSDDGGTEMEKLRKRVQEMNEILEMRESKLIDVSRINMDLQEQNSHLKMQLDGWEKRAEQHQDLYSITDEYTQRMSALEKKFQQSIRERDTLKDQLEILRKDLIGQVSLANIEKDEVIKQLREEGEKLSKQQLQHSNIIKKLRVKEKEADAILQSQKEQLDEQSLELDRLKRSLNAKEEVERSQIEAVHTLTARVRKQEKEISALQEKLDNTTHKMNAYKTSLDAAKSELTETKLNFTAAEEELKQALDNAAESCRLFAQVEDLKAQLRQAEESHAKRVDALKHENNDLLKRLEAAEARSEQLSESVSLVTKPLLRQLEQLQANLAQKSNSYLKQEKLMSEKIEELQTKLENTVATDRTLAEENLTLKSRIFSLESQVKRKDLEREKVEESCESLRDESVKLSAEIDRLRGHIDTMEKTHWSEMKELRREIESLREKISVEKAAIDAEKRKNNPTLEHQASVGDDLRLSPTSSIRRDSISSTNSVWLAFSDSMYDTNSGRFPNVYDGLRTSTNTTSTIETLQAQLKAREGEIQTLQWEMSRRNAERDVLNSELSNLTIKVEELSIKLSEVEALNENLNEVQTRYDALLQMYGEKVEETQELRLDLEDVKEMYKTQIDQLLKRDS